VNDGPINYTEIKKLEDKVYHENLHLLTCISRGTSWRRVPTNPTVPNFPSLSSYFLTPPRQLYTSEMSLELVCESESENVNCEGVSWFWLCRFAVGLVGELFMHRTNFKKSWGVTTWKAVASGPTPYFSRTRGSADLRQPSSVDRLIGGCGCHLHACMSRFGLRYHAGPSILVLALDWPGVCHLIMLALFMHFNSKFTCTKF